MSAHLDLTVRLPELPFRKIAGEVMVCEFDVIVERSFGNVIEELARQYRDSSVQTLVVDPDETFFARDYEYGYGYSSAFSIDGSDLATQYFDSMNFEPEGDYAGSLQLNADVIAVLGSSRRWAFWAQRDWELGVLVVPEARGRWRDVGVSFLDPTEDFEHIRSPAGWSRPLTQHEIAVFRQNAAGLA